MTRAYLAGLCCLVLAACRCESRGGPARAELRLAPATVALVAAPGSSAQAIVTLTNIGTADLKILGVAVDGASAAVFTAGPNNFTVSAAGTAEITVTYSPIVEGDDAARLVIDADASNGDVFVVALQGQARAENTDSGLPDAGGPDAGGPDAGPPDGGAPDGGGTDGGAPDGGAPDAGSDGGAPDGGSPDAGQPDAGPRNVLGFPSGLGGRFSSGGTFSVEGNVGLPAPRVISTGGSFSVEPLIPARTP